MEDLLGPLAIGGGSVVAIGFLAKFWGHFRDYFTKLLSFIIVPLRIDSYELRSGLMEYLHKNCRRSFFGINRWESQLLYVQPRKRWLYVALEVLGSGSRTFWKGIRPIWLSEDKPDRDNGRVRNALRGGETLTVKYLRFTFRPRFFIDKALGEINAYLEEREQDLNYSTDYPMNGNLGRFSVRVIHGSSNIRSPLDGAESDAPPSIEDSFDDSPANRMGRVPYQWDWSQLGPERNQHSLDFLVLNDSQQALVSEINGFLQSRDWFSERGIPWKRGYLLYGPPGCGKSSFVRAIAEKLKLVVYVFDLATLDNSQLTSAWRRSCSNSSRRIMLFEDLDAVFEGRRNVSTKDTSMHQGVTFDCLLNLIDGVDRRDGTILFVTTNNPDRLDPALGKDEGKGAISSRPGRIDRSIFFGGIDRDGKKKLMDRILGDAADEELLAEGEYFKDSPAQFQERCFRKALELRFGPNSKT